MKVSVIIPTYNEEKSIGKLLTYLKKHGDERLLECIVVDGGSEDRTIEIAKKHQGNCLICKQKGRAAQMNMGYKHSSGNLLYFVHADSFPPKTYLNDLFTAIKSGHEAGCYRFRFDSERFLLKINSYFTRFERIMCRGGDQTLFITRSLFKKIGGFRNDFLIMEDYDLIQKIKRETSFKIIPKNVVVSPRKYDKNQYLKVNFANFVIFMMYFFGARQQTMVSAYKNLIYHSKF